MIVCSLWNVSAKCFLISLPNIHTYIQRETEAKTETDLHMLNDWTVVTVWVPDKHILRLWGLLAVVYWSVFLGTPLRNKESMIWKRMVWQEGNLYNGWIFWIVLKAINLREGGEVFVPLNCLLFAVLKEETQHWTRNLPLRMGNFLRGKQLI